MHDEQRVKGFEKRLGPFSVSRLKPQKINIYINITSINIFRVCGNTNIVMLSPLRRYLTVGCCQDLRNTSPARTRRTLGPPSSLDCKGPRRIPNTWWRRPTCPTARFITPCGFSQAPRSFWRQKWGNEPVHPNPSTYKKIASSIIMVGLSVVEQPATKREGVSLLSNTPGWQKPYARPAKQAPRGLQRYHGNITFLRIFHPEHRSSRCRYPISPASIEVVH